MSWCGDGIDGIWDVFRLASLLQPVQDPPEERIKKGGEDSVSGGTTPKKEDHETASQLAGRAAGWLI